MHFSHDFNQILHIGSLGVYLKRHQNRLCLGEGSKNRAHPMTLALASNIAPPHICVIVLDFLYYVQL